MRRSRWLILAAILGIIATVGVTFLQRREARIKNAPAPPPPLESGLDGRANDWVYTQSDGEHPRVTVRAKSFKQIKAPSVMELDGVELQLFHKEGNQFDLVKSAKAEFDITGKSLYADGEVEITMGVSPEKQDQQQKTGRILKIHSSGVRFASDTGKATTDRAATFEFEQGGGSTTGADYDPMARELHLRSDVTLDWQGSGKKSKPMHVQAGEAYYREGAAQVTLLPWSKLTRDTLRLDAAKSVITLEHGVIKETNSQTARGVQQAPGRTLEFGADDLTIHFGANMAVTNIRGQGNGKLISTANATRTTVTGGVLLLDFDPAIKESALKNAAVTGKSVAESQPLPRAGELMADTRVLRSETIHVNMRPGGQEIDTVETDSTGTVDFLPNRPSQPKRWMKGDKIWIVYGPQNRIQSFRSVNAFTRTDKPGQSAPLLTDSKEITALFDLRTNEMTRLDQRIDFHYEEGTRRATADKATLEPVKELITLEGSARAWDPTGSAAADRLVMNQKTGDFTADGRVATTRVPDSKGPANPTSSALLTTAEAMQGRAQHMTSAEANQKLHYEGGAVVWQGANRVEADRIDIDRARQILEAHGKVVSQFADKPKENTARPVNTKPSAPVFTVVRAAELVYTGDTRVALYLGGAAMVRPGLNVTSKELRAFLNDSSAETSLDKALADGVVRIVSSADKRTRTGTSEHAEYYAGEQKVILELGDPLLVDSLKGQTRGKQLTWWANNDRLLVNGVESRPADSLLRKK